MKKLASFLVYSNLLVGVYVSASAITTYWIFNSQPDHTLLAFIFSSTVFLYSLHRIIGFRLITIPKNIDKHNWIKENNIFMFSLCVLTLLVSGLLISLIQTRYYLLLIIPTLLSAGYAIPIIPSKNGMLRLRDIPGIKLFLVCISVVIVTGLLPMSNTTFTITHYLFLFHQLLFFIAITIPFDIRDINIDEKSVQSIPQKIGISRSKRLCQLLLISATLLIIFSNIHFALAIPNLIGILLLNQIKEDTHPFYYTFWIEGLMLVQLIATGLCKL